MSCPAMTSFERRSLALAGQLEEAVAVARASVAELERVREAEEALERWRQKALARERCLREELEHEMSARVSLQGDETPILSLC